jgi:hypothetical protein
MFATEIWNRIAAHARERWARHHRPVLWFSIVLMSVIAARRLARAVTALLAGETVGDTTNIFHVLIHRWFAALPVYSELGTAVHPPATYVILWPFFGWLELEPARWLWAATNIAALAWLAYLIVRESGASTVLERAFVALLLLSMRGTEYTVTIGQFTVLLLPLLLVGLLLLYDRRRGWGRDLLAGVLLLLALVKPPVSAPFLLIALFLPGGLRPTILVALGYAALNFFAVSYQEADLATLLREWLTRSSELAVHAGTANLHIWLAAIGLEKWILPTSLLVFAGLGLWIYRHRHVDLWLLMAVAAIVARFWTYHRAYDDLLLLLPEVALFRLAKRGPSDGGIDVAAAALLALAAIGMLAPIRMLRLSTTGHLLLTGGIAVVWIAMLIFLMKQAAREKSRTQS